MIAFGGVGYEATKVATNARAIRYRSVRETLFSNRVIVG